MATQVQLRRGTTAQHSSFTGAAGELTVDTDKKTAVVHDGSTAGGVPLLRENGTQNAVTTGTSTAASFIPTSSTVPTNGAYLPAANTYGIATGGVERLRVTSTGQVRLAGAGITFNGDTATANELDDYEEGTFTPTIVGASTAGTATYTAQIGAYTKIGNIVHIRINLAWSGGTGTGNPFIAGLPFTCSGDPAFAIGRLDNYTLSANNIAVIHGITGTTTAYLLQYPVGGGGLTNAPYDAAAGIIISGSYHV